MDVILVVLILGVILFGPLCLIAWACWRAFRDRPLRFEALAALSDSPPNSAARLLATMTPMMSNWGYRLESDGPSGIIFSRRYRPAWLIIPCFLLFPLGLLSLAYVRTVDVSFSFMTNDGGTEVVVGGMVPSRLGGEIEAGFSGQLAVGEPVRL